MPDTTMNGCGGGGGSAGALLPASPFYAPRYHFGMLLGVDDFESEQAYHRGKLRLHNAWLHGPGVAWGMEVDVPAVDGAPGTLRGEIRVGPGFALDGAGRELHLEGAACVGVAAWLEANRDDPELQAVLDEREDGTIVFRAHVAACFRACLARPVPSIAEPCEGAGSDTAYSRAQETVELHLRPGKPPAPTRPYHRLRLLFGLRAARTDGGTVVPADQEVLDARAAVLARPAEEQPRAYVEAFRRFAALDGMALRPAELPEEGGTTLFPESDDACLVLADVTDITLAPDGNGGMRLTGAAVDNSVRLSHVATSTIQELLCGPLFAAAAAPPGEEEPAPAEEEPAPAEEAPSAASSGPAFIEPETPGSGSPAEEAVEPGTLESDEPSSGEADGGGAGEGEPIAPFRIGGGVGERARGGPEDAGGPRIDPNSVRVEGETVRMTATSRLARASVREESFSVTAFDNRDGWRTVEIRDVSLDRRGRGIRLEMTNDPGGALVRVIARGTGPRPLLGSDGTPLAGAAGGPPGGEHDGSDFVLMVKRSET